MFVGFERTSLKRGVLGPLAKGWVATSHVQKPLESFEVAMAPVKNQDAFAERNGQVPWDPTISIDRSSFIIATEFSRVFFGGPLNGG